MRSLVQFEDTIKTIRFFSGIEHYLVDYCQLEYTDSDPNFKSLVQYYNKGDKAAIFKSEMNLVAPESKNQFAYPIEIKIGEVEYKVWFTKTAVLDRDLQRGPFEKRLDRNQYPLYSIFSSNDISVALDNNNQLYLFETISKDGILNIIKIGLHDPDISMNSLITDQDHDIEISSVVPGNGKVIVVITITSFKHNVDLKLHGTVETKQIHCVSFVTSYIADKMKDNLSPKRFFWS